MVRLSGGCDYSSGNPAGRYRRGVNPEDPRYKDLIGKYVILPLLTVVFRSLATNTPTWKKAPVREDHPGARL